MADESSEYPYVGTQMPDGSIRIEGPMSPQRAQQRSAEIVTKEKRPAVTTTAKTKGQAIFKIIGGTLTHEKSKSGK